MDFLKGRVPEVLKDELIASQIQECDNFVLVVLIPAFSSFDYAPWNALVAQYFEQSSDEGEQKRDSSAEKEPEVKTPSPPERVKTRAKGKAKVVPVVEVPRPIPTIKLGPVIKPTEKESEPIKGSKDGGEVKGKVCDRFKIVSCPKRSWTGLEHSDLQSVHRSEEDLLLQFPGSVRAVLLV